MVDQSHLVEICQRSTGLLETIVNTVIDKSNGMYVVCSILTFFLSDVSQVSSGEALHGGPNGAG